MHIITPNPILQKILFCCHSCDPWCWMKLIPPVRLKAFPGFATHRFTCKASRCVVPRPSSPPKITLGHLKLVTTWIVEVFFIIFAVSIYIYSVIILCHASQLNHLTLRQRSLCLSPSTHRYPPFPTNIRMSPCTLSPSTLSFSKTNENPFFSPNNYHPFSFVGLYLSFQSKLFILDTETKWLTNWLVRSANLSAPAAPPSPNTSSDALCANETILHTSFFHQKV